jgi:bla regulator protein blaR1
VTAYNVSFTVGFIHEVLDHLWQTTAFAATVAALAFAFRTARARTQCALWMTASVKFLVPFSTLVWAGRHLGWSAATPATLPWSSAIDGWSRPFAQPAVIAAGAGPQLSGAGMQHWIAWIWFAGAMIVLAQWFVRWARLRRRVSNRDGRQ